MLASELQAQVHSYGCACKHRSHQATENYRTAVAAKRRDLERHVGAPPERVADIVREHDRGIVEHERMSRVHARRADHIDQDDLMLASPDENTDADHQREYGHLSAAMSAAGRLRVVKDRTEALTVEEVEALADGDAVGGSFGDDPDRYGGG